MSSSRAREFPDSSSAKTCSRHPSHRLVNITLPRLRISCTQKPTMSGLNICHGNNNGNNSCKKNNTSNTSNTSNNSCTLPLAYQLSSGGWSTVDVFMMSPRVDITSRCSPVEIKFFW